MAVDANLAVTTLGVMIFAPLERDEMSLNRLLVSFVPAEAGTPGAISAFTRVFNALGTQALPSLGPRFRGDERNQEAIQIHLSLALSSRLLSLRSLRAVLAERA